MSHDQTPAPRRRMGRAVALASVAAVATAGTLLSIATANAATSTIDHITGVTPHLVTALTANQVINVAGTGFDEATIASVAVNGCTAPTCIVASLTSLLIKTDNSCTTSSTGVITITDTSGNTAVSVPGTAGGGQALTFVAVPTLATPAAAVRPVMSDNTSGLSYAAQTSVGTSASTKGGAVIRVVSGATGFSTSTTLVLGASLDGVAMTNVKLVGTNGTAGNYFTGTVGAHAADAAPVLKITNNGVSKSFVYGAGGASGVAGTFDFTYGGSSIAVSPAFGPSNGGNKIVISGAAFSTTLASDVVTVGGVSCPVATTPAPTATSLTCTVAAAATPFAGPVTVVVAVTGGLTSVVSAGSTYTYLAQ